MCGNYHKVVSSILASHQKILENTWQRYINLVKLICKSSCTKSTNTFLAQQNSSLKTICRQCSCHHWRLPVYCILRCDASYRFHLLVSSKQVRAALLDSQWSKRRGAGLVSWRDCLQYRFPNPTFPKIMFPGFPSAKVQVSGEAYLILLLCLMSWMGFLRNVSMLSSRARQE